MEKPDSKTVRHAAGPAAWAAALLFGFATDAYSAAVVIEDEQLKQRLVEALAATEAFDDRFDAEVWLVDMSGRLKKMVPDENEDQGLPPSCDVLVHHAEICGPALDKRRPHGPGRLISALLELLGAFHAERRVGNRIQTRLGISPPHSSQAP